MPGRCNLLLAGPMLLVCLVVGFPSESEARAKLAAEDDDFSRPADTRRARDARRDLDARDGRMIDDRDDEQDDRQRRRGSSSDQDWFRDPGYYGYGNFPSNEVRDAVVANARAATARAIFRRAENALSSAVRTTVRTFENSTELSAARKTEKEAYEAYAAARRRALQSVLEDPKYRAIMSLRQELSDQISYRKVNRAVDERTDQQIMDDVMSLATLKMNYAADAREMEKLALDTNAEAKDAQAKFRQASSRVSDLKHDFDDALRNDRDLLAARRNLEDARIARLTASAYLKGAANAAEEAMDFAYYLNRYSRYNGAGYRDYRDYYPYGSQYPYGGY